MKTKFIFIVVVIALVCAPFFFKRIDAGHVGIKVKMYGGDRGVQDVAEVTGFVWYNPLTESVYEVPTYVQNAVFSLSKDEGSRENEEFRVTTKDGLVAAFDVSINYYTPAERVPGIFRKYRKPVSELSKTIVRNYLRDAFNGTASRFTAEMLYEKRWEFESLADSAIRKVLEPEGFIIEQVVILNELRLPQSVTANINEKVEAAQIAMKKQQEVLQARADADKKIEDARGIAESTKILADADNYSFQQRNKELTPLLVQMEMVTRWDGKLPVYGAVPQLFKDVAGK